MSARSTTKKGSPTMSSSALPDVAPPQKPGLTGSFQAVPTLVKVLVAGSCVPLLLGLGQAGTALTGQSGPGDPAELFAFTPGVVSDAVEWVVAGAAGAGLVLGLVLALISFLLRKTTPLGPLASWLVTLAPVVIGLLVGIPALMDGLPEYGFFGVAMVAPWLLLGLALAWISCLLGEGVARGMLGSWRLMLVLVVLALLVSILAVLAYTTVYSLVSVVVTGATLAVLLTPVVRQHCTKG